MSPGEEVLTPTQAVARRMKELRRKQGWTAAQLAERLTAEGLPWDRFTVQNLESGRRRTVTLDEAATLASVLNVAPVNLLVPTDDDGAKYQVTPQTSATRAEVRAWIRGQAPLADQDPRLYFSEVPSGEFTATAHAATGHASGAAFDATVAINAATDVLKAGDDRGER